MDTDNERYFPNQVVVLLPLNVSSNKQIDSKSNIHNFSKSFFFARVLKTKKVHIVKICVWYFINVLRIDFFYFFNAFNKISLQFECSLGEIVTIRATKKLEDSAKVVHKQYMIVASQ